MEQTTSTIQWNKAQIKEVLLTASANPEGQLGQVPFNRLVFKMLQRMYQRQTQDEQADGFTKHYNAVGFNGRDAEFLSAIATKSVQYGRLTPNQTRAVAKSLAKYAGQLEQIAKERMN